MSPLGPLEDLPMEPTTVTDPEPRLITTREGDIGLTREGSVEALPVFCFHGLPGSTRDFRYLAPHLTCCAHVIRMNMPGFASSPVGQVRTVRDWARIPAAVADALGLERYALLAHSFGGGAAILAAANDPRRVAGLVLLASVGARRHRAYAWPRSVVRLLQLGVILPGVRRRIFEFSVAHYRRLSLPPPSDWEELRRHLRLMASLDFRAVGRAARRVACPALVAWASDDRLVEPAIGRELISLIPQATPLELERGGHLMQKTQAPVLAEAACSLLVEAAGS